MTKENTPTARTQQSECFSKTENLKGNSGDGSHGLGSLALVVGCAIGGNSTLLSGLVDDGGKFVVGSHSGFLIATGNGHSYLLAKGADAGHSGTVDSCAGNRLTDTLLSGLGVSHSKIENWFFVLVAEVYFIFTNCQANWDEKTFFL